MAGDDQSLAAQLLHHLADGAPADAEQGHQLIFRRYFVPRLPFAVEDLIFHLVVNLLTDVCFFDLR